MESTDSAVNGTGKVRKMNSRRRVVGIGVVALLVASASIVGLEAIRHQPGAAVPRPITRSSTEPGAVTPPSSTSGSVPQPAGSISVVSYGADPSGVKDSTSAFQQAIKAAEAQPGGTVYVPPGRYVLDDLQATECQLCIVAPVHIVGAGPSYVTLVNELGLLNPDFGKSRPMIEIRTGPHGTPGGGDGTTISGLTLNSSEYQAGTDILDFANDTMLSNLNVEASTSNNQYNPNTFGVRVIAICNPSNFATIHRVDNTIDNVTITGQGGAGNTELDLSCQIGTTVKNVNITGNGMDIYISRNITVNNATLVGQASVGPAYTWVINYSSNVMLDNVTTVGSGGVIVQHLHNEPASNVTVENEVMQDPNETLFVGDVDGLLLENDQLSKIRIDPSISATGIRLQGTTVSGAVMCSHPTLISGLSGLSCQG